MKHDGDSVRWRRRGSHSNPADAGVYSNRVCLSPRSGGRVDAPRRRMALELLHRAGLLRPCENPVPRRPRSLVCRAADQACHLMTPDPLQIGNPAYGARRSVVPTSAANSNSPWAASGPPGSKRMWRFGENSVSRQTKHSRAEASAICDMQSEINRRRGAAIRTQFKLPPNKVFRD